MNAIILHGTGSSPDSYWHPYIKTELEALGYTVWIPQLPNSEKPNLDEWLSYALNGGVFDEGTLLIGHSAGCPLILSILENIESRVKQVVLVAGFVDTVDSNILQKSYDWEKIQGNLRDITFINAVNDPWGCDDLQGRKMFDKLGGTLIINNEGHMGSESLEQPYKEFPLLQKLIK